jgi:hypothetical protein
LPSHDTPGEVLSLAINPLRQEASSHEGFRMPIETAMSGMANGAML